MTIDELRIKLGFETKGEFDSYVADLLDLKNIGSYKNSSAKKRYETALCNFYEFIIKKSDDNK